MSRDPYTNRRSQKPQEDGLLTRDQKHSLQEVMKTVHGRRLMYWILFEHAKVEGKSFTGSSATFHLEGRRSVGVELLEVLKKHTFSQYVEMMEEALHEQLREHQLAALKRAGGQDAY